MGDSLVSWKKKVDKHDDRYVDDDTDCFSPRFDNSMNEVLFIRRDEVNAKAMKDMRMKLW